MAYDPDHVASLTLRQLAEMRRDIHGLTDRQTHAYDVMAKMHTSVLQILDEMRDGFAALRKDINGVKSDVITLENQLFSRHGELLNLQRRFDKQDMPDPEA